MAAALLVGFQNCSQVSFNQPLDSLSSYGSLSLDGQTVFTEMNTPVDFTTAPRVNLPFAPRVSVTAAGSLSTTTANGGTLEVIEAATYTLRYTPRYGFRGNDSGTVFVDDKYGNQVSASIHIVVGNSLHQIEPSLAVRALTCTVCHAAIQSNIVTDFGYGNNYFFYQDSTLPWNNGSVYGDHGMTSLGAVSGWVSANISSLSTVYVPNGNLPSSVISDLTGYGQSAVKTIADYVQMVLGYGAAQGYSTAAAKVTPVNQLYIGAPTSNQILRALQAGSTSADFIYFKDQAQTSPDLSGLTRTSPHVFVADGPLVCDGDLVIDGTLLLSNVQLTTINGCRIYATQTVFVSGPIDFTNENDRSNIQIVSSRAISMGLGAYDPSSCSSPSDTVQDYIGSGREDTVSLRFRDMWTVPSYQTRDGVDPIVRGDSIISDEAAVLAVHPLKDAACEPRGREVGFKHVLLNAPNIQSRYSGQVLGTIIAEIYIGELGSFKYEYDPVFSKVAIFPFLDSSEFFTITK
jgi:hypothetical protein